MINKIIIKGNGQQQILVPEGAQLVRLPGGQMQIIQGGAGQILQQAQTGQNQVILVSRNNAQVSSPSNKQDTTPNKVTERWKHWCLFHFWMKKWNDPYVLFGVPLYGFGVHHCI